MTLQNRAPEPYGDDWRTWARRMVQHLSQVRSALAQQTGGESAAEDGQLMWDRVNEYPVVSKNGEWRQIIIEGGDYSGVIMSNVTAAAANTAYPLTFTSVYSHDITNGTPASRLVFSEGGKFAISFSAQITSASGSTRTFWFWPRVNGSDVTGSTMKATLHDNGATNVVARTAIFELDAGDYIEAMWATDDTSGSLQVAAATAFAPSTPAATIAITRIHG